MRTYLETSHYNDPTSSGKTWDSRHAFLTWIVNRFLSDLPRSTATTIVDFGSSFGHLGTLLCARGYSVIGVEQNERARSFAMTNHPALTMIADLEGLAAQEGTIDAVVAIDSLYHLESPRAVLEAIARLLRPGGRLVTRHTSGELRWLVHRLGRRGTPGSRMLGDACWGFTVAGSSAAIRSVGLEVSSVHFLERGKGAGLRGLYYTCSGLAATLSRGHLAISPGCVMITCKPR